MQYDYIVVGAGIYGAVFARSAVEAGKSVLVLEKRNHIGGNCHSYDHEDSGITVHSYGTHIFHTNDDRIWNYVNRFTSFNSYKHRVLTTHQGRVFSMPINLGTINAFYGENLKPNEVENYLSAKREKIAKPANLEEQAVTLIGWDLYEAFIKGYTTKQWGCEPAELPASIITRLPVRSSYEDAYFNDRYQGIPTDGYTPMFENLLDGIPIELGVDYLTDADHWRSKATKVVYSGPIDTYFNYEFGRLNWRSVRFEVDTLDEVDYQGTSVMNYADVDVPYTRIHEPKHLHPERDLSKPSTVIVKEFSHVDHDEPYYPINFVEDKKTLESYNGLKRKADNVIFGGRLASYKYYDMHQVVGQALATAAKEFNA